MDEGPSLAGETELANERGHGPQDPVLDVQRPPSQRFKTGIVHNMLPPLRFINHLVISSQEEEGAIVGGRALEAGQNLLDARFRSGRWRRRAGGRASSRSRASPCGWRRRVFLALVPRGREQAAVDGSDHIGRQGERLEQVRPCGEALLEVGWVDEQIRYKSNNESELALSASLFGEADDVGRDGRHATGGWRRR